MNSKHTEKPGVIHVKNIQQTYEVGDESLPILRKVDFSIQPGSFTLIFGSSGSGKSTLLNVLAGLQPPSTGSVIIEDQDIYSLSPDELAHFRANKIGFMHQTNHWIKSLNVIENVSLPLYFLGYSKVEAEKLALKSLDRVNMGSYAKKSPLILSGGEQQRIGMARALANDPLFIIADEPTGNLDTDNGDTIMNLLLECQTELQRTIILVTHNLEYIALADHLLRIHDGKVEDIPSSDTKEVTNVLLKGIEDRVQHLREARKHATKNHS